jgi:DNA-binding NtrC family response regulator
MAIDQETTTASDSTKGARVLFVDDDPDARGAIHKMLARVGYVVVACESLEEALDHFRREEFEAVLTDVQLRKDADSPSGYDVLRAVQDQSPATQVVLVTGHATMDLAMSATGQGAFAYLSKPVRIETLAATMDRAVRTRRALLADAGKPWPKEYESLPPDEKRLIGRSQAMLTAFTDVAKAAPLDSSVLILGENGTGKERVALELHRHSPRADKPFVAVNVNAMPITLAESMLFGHKRGSFTDAIGDQVGFFESANGGTLFLDEIGDLSAEIQVKLLRTLQERTIRRIGDRGDIPVDIRLVCATNRDLLAKIRSGAMREDFYYRINVVQIVLPPLRERGDDVVLLAEYLLARQPQRPGQPAPKLTKDASERLRQYSWPGNVRELENVIQRACTFAGAHGVITPDLLQLDEQASEARRTTPNRWVTLKEVENDYVASVLEHTNGNLSKAARILGVSRKTLQRKAARGDADS